MLHRLRLNCSPAALLGSYGRTRRVLDRKRKLLGYIDVAALKSKWEAGEADPVSLVSCPGSRMSLYSTRMSSLSPSPGPFASLCALHISAVPSAVYHLPCVVQSDKVEKYMTKFKRTGTTYTVIAPSTPLAELEDFLSRNIFAIVTDWDRKFVLGVVTSQDLEVRPSAPPSSPPFLPLLLVP